MSEWFDLAGWSLNLSDFGVGMGLGMLWFYIGFRFGKGRRDDE